MCCELGFNLFSRLVICLVSKILYVASSSASSSTILSSVISLVSSSVFFFRVHFNDVISSFNILSPDSLKIVL